MFLTMFNLLHWGGSNASQDDIIEDLLREARYTQVSSLFLTRSLFQQNEFYQNKYLFMFDCFLSKDQKELGHTIDIFHTRHFVDTSLENFTSHLYECLKGIKNKLECIFTNTNLSDNEKKFLFCLKYGNNYVNRKGIKLFLYFTVFDNEGIRRKRCMGAIKVMLCDLYVTYHRLCRYDRLLYMEGKRQEECMFLQVHLSHFILSVHEKIMLLKLTKNELNELEMMWTCNFTILQMQNSIHCEKMVLENANNHLCVSERFITHRNDVTDTELCYMYTEWDRIVCNVNITTPEELDTVVAAFNNAKCWLKVDLKNVKKYQESVRKLEKNETKDLYNETKEDLFIEQPIRKERCELLDKIKQHYEKYLTGDKDKVENLKKIHRCMYFDIYNDLKVFVGLFTKTKKDETTKYDPNDINKSTLSLIEYYKKLFNLYNTYKKTVPDTLMQKMEELTKEKEGASEQVFEEDQTTTLLPSTSTDNQHFTSENTRKKDKFEKEPSSKKRKTSAVEIIEGEREEQVKEEVNVREVEPEFENEEQVCAVYEELGKEEYEMLESDVDSLLSGTGDDVSFLTHGNVLPENVVLEEETNAILPVPLVNNETVHKETTNNETAEIINTNNNPTEQQPINPQQYDSFLDEIDAVYTQGPPR